MWREGSCKARHSTANRGSGADSAHCRLKAPAKVAHRDRALKVNPGSWRSLVKSESPTSAACVLALLVLVSTTCALAQERRPVHLSGLINDYVPLLAPVKGSPYEMHGQ